MPEEKPATLDRREMLMKRVLLTRIITYNRK